MSSNNLLSHAEIWDDSELIKMYDEGVKGVNIASSDRSSSKTASGRRKWRVGEVCMAPWEEQWYPAKIIRIIPKERTAVVQFEGFEDEGDISVDLKDLFGPDEVEYQDEQPEVEQSQDIADEPAALSATVAVEVASSIKMETAPVPTILPPPPELFATMTDDKEITNNMMLSWYMSGYHTGYYQAMKDLKAQAAAKK
uniref:Tudor domain-containing protein n=1 Tax=Panagrellus redivivus TaxID=6233 RepID=A0A7E4URA8_PANRE